MKTTTQTKKPPMPLLKRLFWVYFLLLIFEGALRKWIVPQLSAPLLLIRDPVSVLIIWEAYRTHKWPSRWTSVCLVLAAGLVGLAVVQSVAVGNPWFAAVYGLRSYLLPFPVVFIMAENLDADDVRKFGVCILWLLLPLTLLEVVQYISPSSSFWNAGAGEGVEQLGLGGGHVRASATFSFVQGPMLFVPTAAAFIFNGLANPGTVKKWLLGAASFALVLAIPVTGSRTLVFEIATLLLLVGIGSLFGVSQFARSLQLILPLVFVFALVSQLPVFADATNTLTQRFEEADAGEGGSAESSIYMRMVEINTWSIESSLDQNDLLGIGLGRGANAITRLLEGSVSNSAGEGDISRVLNEFGWPCGMAFLLFRFVLATMIVVKAFGKLRAGQPLAWLLLPVTFLLVLQGGIDQPTTQGFMVLCVGFSLAHPENSQAPQRQVPIFNPVSRKMRATVFHSR